MHTTPSYSISAIYLTDLFPYAISYVLGSPFTYLRSKYCVIRLYGVHNYPASPFTRRFIHLEILAPSILHYGMANPTLCPTNLHMFQADQYQSTDAPHLVPEARTLIITP